MDPETFTSAPVAPAPGVDQAAPPKSAPPAPADLAELNHEAASDNGFEFEYVTPAGAMSGIWLRVIGGESAVVKAATNKLMDDRRVKENVALAAVRPGRPAPHMPTEGDVMFGKRLAAVRLIGWRGAGQTSGLDDEQKARFRGITQPYTPDLALWLMQKNDEMSAQVLAASNDMGNFTQASSKNS